MKKKKDIEYENDDEFVTHVYRLVFRPDNTVRVDMDNEQIDEGNMHDDWYVLLPSQIPDTTDEKPTDWVEESWLVDHSKRMID